MTRAQGARDKVHGALPRTPARGKPPETPAPFSFSFIVQNGPRRQGFASPRIKRAPLTAPGRSAESPLRRKRGLLVAGVCRLPLVGLGLHSRLEPENTLDTVGPPHGSRDRQPRCEKSSGKWLLSGPPGLGGAHHFIEGQKQFARYCDEGDLLGFARCH